MCGQSLPHTSAIGEAATSAFAISSAVVSLSYFEMRYGPDSFTQQRSLRTASREALRKSDSGTSARVTCSPCD